VLLDSFGIDHEQKVQLVLGAVYGWLKETVVVYQEDAYLIQLFLDAED